MSPLAVFAIAAIGTYVIRVTMLVLLAGLPLPEVLVTPVGLIGPAAVGALTAGALVHRGHLADVSTVAGTLVSFVVVRLTKQVTHGLIAGFAVVWVIKTLETL